MVFKILVHPSFIHPLFLDDITNINLDESTVFTSSKFQYLCDKYDISRWDLYLYAINYDCDKFEEYFRNHLPDDLIEFSYNVIRLAHTEFSIVFSSLYSIQYKIFFENDIAVKNLKHLIYYGNSYNKINSKRHKKWLKMRLSKGDINTQVIEGYCIIHNCYNYEYINKILTYIENHSYNDILDRAILKIKSLSLAKEQRVRLSPLLTAVHARQLLKEL